MDVVPKEELLARLAQFQESHDLPGLGARESRERFVEKLLDRQKSCALGGEVLQLFVEANRDERLWLAFLVTHFGTDVPETVHLFYSKFGAGRWGWETVRRSGLDSLRDWMHENREKLKKLKFGNHRKRRIMDPDHPRGTWNVIRSFVDWVEKHGSGSPCRAFEKHTVDSRSPEDGFDRLYQALEILDFGRTAKFDLLCLLGNLRFFDIAPGHCYLKHATGPKAGALLMVTGHKEGKLTSNVDDTIRKLTKHLGVPVEAMEDALCNWQKPPRKKRTAEPANLIVTCR